MTWNEVCQATASVVDQYVTFACSQTLPEAYAVVILIHLDAGSAHALTQSAPIVSRRRVLTVDYDECDVAESHAAQDDEQGLHAATTRWSGDKTKGEKGLNYREACCRAALLDPRSRETRVTLPSA